MRSLLLLGFACLSAAAQDPEPPEEPPVEEPVKQPAPAPEAPEPEPLELSFREPPDADTVEAALRDFAIRHPGRARVEAFGTSGGGRELLALVLGDLADGDEATRPGLLLLAHEIEGSGASIALRTAQLLLDEADGDGDSILRDCTVYLLPAADPETEPGGVRFGCNFPIGWRPDSLRPGSGNYPLSEPETWATADFLASHPNIAVVLEAATAGKVAATGERASPAPEADAALFQSLAGRGGGDPRLPRLVPCTLLDEAGGGVLDFAYEALGMIACRVADGRAPRDGGERVAQVDAGARLVLQLARELPQVTLAAREVVCVRPGLYRIDLTCGNRGVLPTLSELGLRRHAAGEIELALTGGNVIACAHRRGDAGYEVAAGGAERFPIGQIAGGGEVELRLVVEAEPGSELELRGVSTRAGVAVLAIPLPG